MKTIAVIPAAGLGKRLGNKKKPFLMLSGMPLLAHTLRAFEECASIDGIIITTATEDIERCREEVVNKYDFSKVIAVVSGGKERQESIANALEEVGDTCEVVVVHDAARPLVTPEVIECTVKAAGESGAAITAVPLKDTVKSVSGGRVQETLRRDTLRAVQTPQAFKSDILKRAYAQAKEDGFVGTDDSSLVERLGITVTIIDGNNSNIKVTTKEDIVIAECLLKEKL